MMRTACVVVISLHVWNTLFVIDIMLINVLQLSGMIVDGFKLSLLSF